MNGDDEMLRNVYALYVDGGGERLRKIEHNLGIAGEMNVSEDLRRNERDVYRALLDEQGHHLDELFNALLHEMQGLPFDRCSDLLDGLSFVQLVAARALWKHHLHVNEQLKRFAKDFDRLDVPSERRRLHEIAQNS